MATSCYCPAGLCMSEDGAYQVRSLAAERAESVRFERVLARLVGGFAALALALAAAGVYAVTSWAVEQRRHEVGVRMACGASCTDVLKLMLGTGVRPALAGVAAGMPAAWALVRWLASVIEDARAVVLPSLGGACAILLAAAVLAALAPARRAASSDPIEALRVE